MLTRWDAHDQALDSGVHGIDRREHAAIWEPPDPPDWSNADPTPPTQPGRDGWEIPRRQP